MPKPPPPESPFWKLFGAATKLNTVLFKATKGRIGGKVPGAGKILILHHVGAKSGTRRETPLQYIEDGNGGIALVASKGGVDRHPAWFHNLKANPDVEVDLPGGEHRQVRARVVEGEERDRWWKHAIDTYKTYDTYQSYTERRIPVIVLDRR
jgi:deazaflavin-dependent oxidoreductase (nitroreductase family)